MSNEPDMREVLRELIQEGKDQAGPSLRDVTEAQQDALEPDAGDLERNSLPPTNDPVEIRALDPKLARYPYGY